jgi:hypothetical protein
MPPRVSINININMPVDNLAEFQDAIKILRDSEVLVGVPAAKAARDDAKSGVSKPGINNAALLYINDKGCPELNIPARPVVDPGIMDKKLQIEGEMLNTGRMILAGRDPHDGLARAGQTAVDGIKARITSNTPPALAKRTIQARRRRGVTRTNTLVDKAKMLNAVTWVIRKKRAT